MNGSWKSRFQHSHTRTLLFGFVTGLLVFIITQSLILSSPFALLAAGSHFAIARGKKNKFASQLSTAWPEVIDHLISGISSGLSLAESLTGLASRGPEIVRPAFHEFHMQLQKDGDFSGGIQNLKTYLSQYRIVNDSIKIRDGFVINIGVDFDIIILPNYNNNDVLFKCLTAVKDYFNIDKWQSVHACY